MGNEKTIHDCSIKTKITSKNIEKPTTTTIILTTQNLTAAIQSRNNTNEKCSWNILSVCHDESVKNHQWFEHIRHHVTEERTKRNDSSNLDSVEISVCLLIFDSS